MKCRRSIDQYKDNVIQAAIVDHVSTDGSQVPNYESYNQIKLHRTLACNGHIAAAFNPDVVARFGYIKLRQKDPLYADPMRLATASLVTPYIFNLPNYIMSPHGSPLTCFGLYGDMCEPRSGLALDVTYPLVYDKNGHTEIDRYRLWFPGWDVPLPSQYIVFAFDYSREHFGRQKRS